MSAVQKIEIQEPQLPARVTPTDSLKEIIAAGATFEVIKLMKETIEWSEGREARKEFDHAISAAKAEIPVIIKNATGHNAKKYADFASIARTVDPILSRHGLSYRFRTIQDEKLIRVTCVLSHEAGHYEENTLATVPDTSGNKSPIHAMGSALTYLQRYTLVQALGLASAEDDDGGAAGAGEKITADEAQSLSDIIAKVSGLPFDAEKNPVRDRLLRWVSTASRHAVTRVADIPSTLYDGARNNLETLAKARS